MHPARPAISFSANLAGGRYRFVLGIGPALVLLTICFSFRREPDPSLPLVVGGDDVIFSGTGAFLGAG